MSRDLNGKVGLVTGASSGIGRASAVVLGAAGATVVVAARRAAELDETAELVRAAGGVAEPIVGDVTDPGDVARFVAAAARLGGLDFAFNNAGSSLYGADVRLHERDDAFWDHYYRTFLRSVFECMRAELAVMLAHGGGAIVNNASVAGLVANAANPIYTSMKFAVVGLTRASSLQYGEDGIRINAVCPGWIDTAMTAPWEERPEWTASLLSQQAQKRIGRPEEVAELVAWLCSDRASFMNGVAVPIDGGLSA